MKKKYGTDFSTEGGGKIVRIEQCMFFFDLTSFIFFFSECSFELSLTVTSAFILYDFSEIRFQYRIQASCFGRNLLRLRDALQLEVARAAEYR